MNTSKFIRYTVGNCSDLGLICLKKSLKNIKKFYPHIEILLFYNKIEESQLKYIKNLNVQIIEQNPSCLPFTPSKVEWKLYPPRYSLSSHELFIDNDIIISNPLKKIEDFFNNKDQFIYTQGLFKAYGNLSSKIPEDINLNSGIFGIPPHFDFEKEIRILLKQLDGWKDYYDEQGMIAKIFSEQKNKIQINLEEIFICDKSIIRNNLLPKSKNGYHFVGLNKGDNFAWNIWKRRII